MPFFIFTFFLQGTLILIDEFFCHWRREVPKWERWGHPMDTFFLLVPLFMIAIFPSSQGFIYGAFAVFSCLFITKDEWVHSKMCTPFENWLHALLFVLHPVVFILAWQSHDENIQVLRWLLVAPAAFLIYQITYWNFYADS